MQYYLGIDPGKNGGFALIDEHRNIVFLEKMPLGANTVNYFQIYRLIQNLPSDTTILIELRSGMVTSSAAPTGSFSFHCGVLYGICLDKKTILISPKKWKEEFALQRNYKESRQTMKARSVRYAEKLFNITLKANQDGLADALLLAEFGRRNKL